MGLYDKDLQKLQALMMVAMRVKGKGNKEIAMELNVHPDTVERRLAFAKKAGLYLDLERQLYEELVPLAMTAVKTAMADGDAETALEILKSVGVIKDSKTPKSQIQQGEDDELARAIAGAREDQLKLEGTIDGTIVSGRSNFAGLLEASNDRSDDTPTEASVDSQRDPVEPGVEVLTTETA